MPASQPANFNLQEFTDVGKLMVGGRLYTYSYGTTALKIAYTDPDGTVPHAYTPDGLGGQFIALNTRGELPAPLFLGEGSYDIALKRADGSTVWTRKADGVENSIRAWEASLTAAAGSGLIGFVQTGVGATKRNAQSKLRDMPKTPEDYGAAGDDTADDTLSIQKLLDAAPVGGVVEFPNKYKITAPVYIRKPLTLRWPNRGPYSIAGSNSYVRQSTIGVDAFVLVPQAMGVVYAFAYGITDVHFDNARIQGHGIASRGGRGIGVDQSVNGGDFHIRGCTFTNLNILYFVSGVDLTGIAYLNHFYNTNAAYCNTGVKIARGSASDNGGQTRFFGGSIVACDTCLSLNEGASAGSFSIFGMTLSESKYGIRVAEECAITIMGNEFEALQNGGNGAGLYIPISETNPTSTGPRTVIGNKFLSSDADIWINKTSENGGDGAFAFPMLIDGNYLGSATALRIDVPGGHQPLSSPAFVLGDTNSGPAGAVSASQLSPNFRGVKRSQRRITRRYLFSATTPSGAVLDSFPAGMVIQTVRAYLASQATTFTAIKIGTNTDDGAYLLFDASGTPIETWQTYSSNLGDVVGGSNAQLRFTLTAEAAGYSGVIEIDGYIP